MLNSVNAIIFDLGGVILNLDYQLTIDAFRNLGKDDFDQLYRQAYQDKIFDQYETGQISSAEFRSYLKTFYDTTIQDEQIDDSWNVMLLDLPQERVDLLMNLKNDYRIFLLSNTNELHYNYFRNTVDKVFGDPNLLEDIFEKTYYSHFMNERKPNAEAFLNVLNENQLSAETTLFIDDSEQHIEGAKKVGLQTILLKEVDIVDIFQ